MNSQELEMRQLLANQAVRNMINDKVDTISYYGGALSDDEFDLLMLDIISKKNIKRVYPTDDKRFFNLKKKFYPTYRKALNVPIIDKVSEQEILEDFYNRFDKFVAKNDKVVAEIKNAKIKKPKVKKQKNCDSYKSAYHRFLCLHPGERDAYLKQNDISKCENYMLNKYKREGDTFLDSIKLLQKKDLIKKVKKTVKKPVEKILELAYEPKKEINMEYVKEKMPNTNYKTRSGIMMYYKKLLEKDPVKAKEYIDNKIKGGYFLPPEEEMINDDMVNSMIQRVIKAQGASYGGELMDLDDYSEYDDDIDVDVDEDEMGGCFECDDDLLGGAANRKSKKYKAWLKLKKFKDSAKKINEYNKLMFPKKVAKKTAKKKTVKKESAWIAKVKAYQQKHKVTYKEAMQKLAKKKPAKKVAKKKAVKKN